MFNLFTIWLQDMVGIIIYPHLFFNWVLWIELKSRSACKRSRFSWIDQLSSDTKPLVCPCSAHIEEPIADSIGMRLKSVQLWFIKGRVFDFFTVWVLRTCMFHILLQNQKNSVTFMHLPDKNYSAFGIQSLSLGIKPMTLALLASCITSYKNIKENAYFRPVNSHYYNAKTIP